MLFLVGQENCSSPQASSKLSSPCDCSDVPVLPLSQLSSLCDVPPPSTGLLLPGNGEQHRTRGEYLQGGNNTRGGEQHQRGGGGGGEQHQSNTRGGPEENITRGGTTPEGGEHQRGTPPAPHAAARGCTCINNEFSCLGSQVQLSWKHR